MCRHFVKTSNKVDLWTPKSISKKYFLQTLRCSNFFSRTRIRNSLDLFLVTYLIQKDHYDHLWLSSSAWRLDGSGLAGPPYSEAFQRILEVDQKLWVQGEVVVLEGEEGEEAFFPWFTLLPLLQSSLVSVREKNK